MPRSRLTMRDHDAAQFAITRVRLQEASSAAGRRQRVNHRRCEAPAGLCVRTAGLLVGVRAECATAVRREFVKSKSVAANLKSWAGELLDAVVAVVRHVHLAAGIRRQTTGIEELSVPRPVAPPRAEEDAVRVELVDASLVVVRHEDVPG